MYYEKVFYFDGLVRFFVFYQYWLYYIIMGVVRYNLYLQSFFLVFFLSKGRNKIFELFGLVFFWIWYIYLCLYLFSWFVLFVFVFVVYFFVGFFYIQIILSYFFMEIYYGYFLDVFKSNQFFFFQLVIIMDIECYLWLDFVYGGLQF